MSKFHPKLLLIFYVILFSTCKKGEDDPFISFRSRKARAVGEWKMTSGKVSISSSGYNESYTFDGTNVRVNVTSVTPVIYTGKANLYLKMNSDGSFEFSETLSTYKLKAQGNWNFNTGVAKEKKKESLIFDITKVTYGYTDGNTLFNRFSSYFIYHLKELRNKKIVVTAGGKIYSGVSGDYASVSNEYVFEPQN